MSLVSIVEINNLVKKIIYSLTKSLILLDEQVVCGRSLQLVTAIAGNCFTPSENKKYY